MPMAWHEEIRQAIVTTNVLLAVHAGASVAAAPTLAVQTIVLLSNIPAIVVSANLTRRQLILANDAGTVYVLFGAGTVSANKYTLRLTANEVYVGALNGYNGVVTAVRASGSSSLMVTDIRT